MANPTITVTGRVTRPWIDRDAIGAASVAIVAAVIASVLRAGGADDEFVVLPLLAAAGLGMAWLAMRNFTYFVAVILLLRASLDELKVSEGTTSLLDPAALLSAAFLVAGGLWLLVQPKGERAPASPLVAPLGLLALAGAVSTMTAPSPASGMVDVVKLATVVLMIAVLNQVCRRERDAKIVLGAALISTAIPLATAAFGWLTRSGFHYSDGFARTTGTFNHPNPFAIYLVFGALMSVAVSRGVRGWLRAATVALAVACSVTLYFTYTRSGWIALVVGLLTLAALSGKKIVGFVAIGVVVLGLSIPTVAARFADLDDVATQSLAAGNSLVWRLEYWRQALTLSDDPILGSGLTAVKTEGSEGKEPHNDFIRVFVETGILGMAAYLWFLWRGVGVIRNGLRETHEGLWRAVVIGFGAAFAAYVLLSLVSNVITQLVLLWYLGAYASLAVAAPRLAPRGDDPEPEPAAEAAPAFA